MGNTWNRLTAVKGEGIWGTGQKNVKELAPKYIYITHRHRQECGDSQREKGLSRWRWAKGREMQMERDFPWGNGCTMQHAHHFLLGCTLETCVVL